VTCHSSVEAGEKHGTPPSETDEKEMRMRIITIMSANLYADS